MSTDDLRNQKSTARREARLLRDQAHAAAAPGAVEAANRHLLSALARFRGRPVSAYLAMGSELDPLPAMERLAALGPVLLPEVRAKAQPLRFRRWTPDAVLADGVYGTRHPAEGEEMEPAALVVPLLAFDLLGHRLGYGGGFYDRTLSGLRARNPGTFAVGFAYSAQEVAALPVGPFDARLDAVVTEKGLVLDS